MGQGIQTAPGDLDGSATGSKPQSGSVPASWGCFRKFITAHQQCTPAEPTSSAHHPCAPAVHGFCFSHALPGAGCFLVHSQHLVSWFAFPWTPWGLYRLSCAHWLCVPSLEKWQSLPMFMCMYIYDPCMCAYLCVQAEARRGYWMSYSITLFLIPLSRGLKLNLVWGWQPAGPSEPPVTAAHCAGVTGTHNA